jgi:hypothetical protein
MKLNDELRGWLAPLVSEAHSRGMELSAETLTAAKPPEGQLYGPMNWVLFGQLIIRRLDWEDTYPNSPSSQRVPETP